MRLFLVNPLSYPINLHSIVRFTGSELELYFKNNLISSTPASPGECFFVRANGKNNPVTIIKEEMPDTRGKRIAWALDFDGKEKWVDSYNEFQKRCFKLLDEMEVNSSMCSMKDSQYGILLTHKITDSSRGLKPSLAWISEDITDESLANLISLLRNYRQVNCGVDFLKLL